MDLRTINQISETELDNLTHLVPSGSKQGGGVMRNYPRLTNTEKRDKKAPNQTTNY